MKITWLGHACFKIQGKDVIIVTDPYNPKIGLRKPSTKADILLISHDHDDHNFKSAITENPFIIDGPGEYELKHVMIQGIEAYHDKLKGKKRGTTTLYSFQMEGVNFVHLGDIGHVTTDYQVEHLGDVDILFIPIGGKYTIGTKSATKIINAIEPRIVIPMHFKVPGLTLDIADNKEFCEEMGVDTSATQDVYKVSKRELPQEETQVVVLQPQKINSRS